MSNHARRCTTLTQLRLNLRHPEAKRDLDNTERMHRRVMSLLPDALGEQARANAGVLYRVEQETSEATVLIQAHYPPNLATLPPGYAAAATQPLDAVLTNLTRGLTVRYRIRANPTHIETTDDKRKIRRWIRGDDAVTWWRRRAQQAGLEPHTALLTNEEVLTITRGAGKETKISHGASLFEGTATITDPEAARQAVLTGVGRARAYGCGLLSLAPARS